MRSPDDSDPSTKRPKHSGSSTRLVDLGWYQASTSGYPISPQANNATPDHVTVPSNVAFRPEPSPNWWEQTTADGAPPRPPRYVFRRGSPRIKCHAERKAERDYWTYIFTISFTKDHFRAWMYWAQRQKFIRRRTAEELAKRATGATKSNASGRGIPAAAPPGVSHGTARFQPQVAVTVNNQAMIEAAYPTTPGAMYFRVDGMIAVVPEPPASPEHEMSFSLDDLNSMGHAKAKAHRSRNYPM